jgi:hypothetical protein
MVDDLRPFRSALLNMPGVEAVSDADQLPIQVGSNFSGVGWKGKSPTDDILFDNLLTGYDFQKTMQLEMVEGRTFSPEFATDTNGIVINETAAKVMSLKPCRSGIDSG